MREINLIVIHCSASDHKTHDNPRIIKQWHLERGFNDIGYHFVITKANNGKIHIGRRVKKSGAHVRGKNSHSIGICLTGLNKFSEQQIESCVDLVRLLMDIFDLTIDNVKGHYELDNKKTCPNINMDDLRGLINGK